MKIGKVTKVITQGVVDEGTIEVSGWKVLTGLLSAGILTGLVTSLTFILIDLPNNNLNREQDARREKLEILNFVLRAKSDTVRKESLIFLLKSEILSDNNYEIQRLVDQNIIPNWSNMPNMSDRTEQSETVPIFYNKRNLGNIEDSKIGIQEK